MTSYTEGDLRVMAQVMRQSKDRGKPFAVLFGAGASVAGGVPAAAGLVDLIRHEYGEIVARRLPPQRSDYASAMGCLTFSERRELLRPILDRAMPTDAHLALAALVAEGLVGRILTFNFDMLIERACAAAGVVPAVYDFAAGTLRSTDHIASPAILHFHGQGFGLAAFNTEREAEAHADEVEPALLDTLDRFPLLIVGYSGREDNLYPRLLRAYRGRQRLYWIARNRAEPEPHVQALINKAFTAATYLSARDADTFMSDLARIAGCWPLAGRAGADRRLPPEIGAGPAPVPEPPVEAPPPPAAPEAPDETEALAIQAPAAPAASEPEPEAPEPASQPAAVEESESPATRVAEAPVAELPATPAESVAPESEAEPPEAAEPQAETAATKEPDAAAEVVEATPAARPEPAPTVAAPPAGSRDLPPAAATPPTPPAVPPQTRAFADHAAFARLSGQLRREINGGGEKPSGQKIYLRPAPPPTEPPRVTVTRDRQEPEPPPASPPATLRVPADGTTVALPARNPAEAPVLVGRVPPPAAAPPAAPPPAAAGDERQHLTRAVQLVQKAIAEQQEPLFDQAFAEFEAALRVNPRSYQGLLAWGDALMALASRKRDEQPYRQSFARFEAATRLEPDNPAAYLAWGNALAHFAGRKRDQALYEESIGKYQKAAELRPDNPVVLANWGNALLGLARIKQDKATYLDSCSKFAAAFKIEPNSMSLLNNWSAALMGLWHLQPDASLLDATERVLTRAEKVSGKPQYNLACVAALRGEEQRCRQLLEECRAAGTLPPAARLRADRDLDSVRGSAWFQEFLD
jgi:tetratricopeptide (TPR) repeat protein